MKRPRVKVTTHTERGRLRFAVQVMEYDKRGNGHGVSFSLTPAAATRLADQLNALLDDPSDDDKDLISQ
jgi:hypothetical protein